MQPLPVPPLARRGDVLAAAAGVLREAGIAGEEKIVKLIYLVVVTRFLDRLVSLAVKGPSAGGKSYLVAQVLALFPADAYYALSAMSERALIYDTTPLAHCFLVIYEAAGMAGDIQTYIIRSLLSEGRVRYVTVEKTKGGMRPRLIEREGPTGLITTTTEIKLHPENETRLLSVTVTDSPEQTRAVLLAQATGGSQIDVEPWHELARWLAANVARVAIPYLVTLAENIPPAAVRLRRDFPSIIALIQAHALLHQATRERRADGAIVATIDDYAQVRALVADLVADAAERSVSATVRETVAAVAGLIAGGKEDTTVLAVGQRLGLDKGAASRRVRSAIERGYLKNLEDRRGRPARLVADEPLPDEQAVLPLPEDLERLHGCSATAGDQAADARKPVPGFESADRSVAPAEALPSAEEAAFIPTGIPPEPTESAESRRSGESPAHVGREGAAHDPRASAAGRPEGGTAATPDPEASLDTQDSAAVGAEQHLSHQQQADLLATVFDVFGDDLDWLPGLA